MPGESSMGTSGISIQVEAKMNDSHQPMNKQVLRIHLEARQQEIRILRELLREAQRERDEAYRKCRKAADTGRLPQGIITP